MVKRLNDEEMIEHYTNLVKTYGKDGKLNTKWILGMAIIKDGKISTYTDVTSEYYLVDTPAKEMKEDYPLSSILINKKVGKYDIYLTELEKKLWPNKWDVRIGGHVNAGEFGRQALIRECKEELGIEISDDDIKYIVSTTSIYNKNNYINNHYDECYLITKNINIEDLKLQQEEVSDVKYFSKEELLNRINNNYDELTVLSNLESHYAEMIKEWKSKEERFEILSHIAKYQLNILNKDEKIKLLEDSKEYEEQK